MSNLHPDRNERLAVRYDRVVRQLRQARHEQRHDDAALLEMQAFAIRQQRFAPDVETVTVNGLLADVR